MPFGLGFVLAVSEVFGVVVGAELDEVFGVEFGEESTEDVGVVVGADVSFEPREDVSSAVGVDVCLVVSEAVGLEQTQRLTLESPGETSGGLSADPLTAVWLLMPQHPPAVTPPALSM